MPKYNNREELNKVINEGYFNKPTYENIGYREILLEKVLNIAKNNKDETFRQISKLVEEVEEMEKDINSEDVQAEFDKVSDNEEYAEFAIRNLPITTVAIKQLSPENIESLKWVLLKKIKGSSWNFSDDEILQLDDNRFKKVLINFFFRNKDDNGHEDIEKDFLSGVNDTREIQQLAENFVKYIGSILDEEEDFNDTQIDYYYLVKKQIDAAAEGNQNFHSRLKDALSFTYDKITSVDGTSLISNLPDTLKPAVTVEFIKKGDIIEDEDENHVHEEDEEFENLAAADEELDTEQMSVDEQIKRQTDLLETLKELYIIKRTREIVMLENSKVLKDPELKKRKLSRVLLFEELQNGNSGNKYGENLTKIGILVESLFRKYATELIED